MVTVVVVVGGGGGGGGVQEGLTLVLLIVQTQLTMFLCL